MPIRRPMTAAQIARVAADFRECYAPRGTGAIDIECIIEHDFHMDIVPEHNLMMKVGAYGFLACDGRSIFVDAAVQRDDVQEYRALITHELGHAILHSQLLPTVLPENAGAYRAFHAQFTQLQVTTMEYEARQWAMSVLMPPSELESVFSSAFEEGRDYFPNFRGPARFFVEHRVASHFDVSLTRAQVRIGDEKLWRRMQRWLKYSAASRREPIRNSRPIRGGGS